MRLGLLGVKCPDMFKICVWRVQGKLSDCILRLLKGFSSFIRHYLMCFSFSNLQKWFTWDPIYENRIKKNFENRYNARLRDFLSKVRKHNKKPQWFGDDQWKGLQEHWANEAYKKLCKKAQKHRLGDQFSLGPSFHTYGSIRMHKHRSRLVASHTSYNVILLSV